MTDRSASPPPLRIRFFWLDKISVENPEVVAQKALAEQAQAQSNLDAEAQLIGDTQEEYLKWLMGGK